MHTKNLINGNWIDADNGGTLAVLNPATDEVIAEVPACGAVETRRAIEAAEAALPAWRTRTAGDRGAVLRRLSELLLRDADDLARLLTLEQGKPLAEARGEIAYAASFIDWAAEEGKRLYGETIPASAPNKRILVLRQPVGVTASITPWNFPSAMITRKLGPALAAGCTMVVKPSEETPLSALALGGLCIEAGVPEGVVGFVTGDPEAIGAEMLSNPVVRKVSFTGSTAVGRILMRQGATNLTRLSLELGGHAPFIVFEDADIPAAVAGAMASKFRNTGQTCICANRFLVADAVHDEFVAGFEQAVAALRVGNGLDDGVQVGPLINDAAVEKVQTHVQDAVDQGARVRVGGDLVAVEGAANRFFAPTILDGVTGDMLASREETFGPVAPIRRFRHDDEAIEWANDSQYGLAAYFYTRDAARSWRVAEALEYGIIGLNDAVPSTAQAPFGGMKHSGFGREGGHHGMREYLEEKFVSWGLS